MTPREKGRCDRDIGWVRSLLMKRSYIGTTWMNRYHIKIMLHALHRLISLASGFFFHRMDVELLHPNQIVYILWNRFLSMPEQGLSSDVKNATYLLIA